MKDVDKLNIDYVRWWKVTKYYLSEIGVEKRWKVRVEAVKESREGGRIIQDE